MCGSVIMTTTAEIIQTNRPRVGIILIIHVDMVGIPDVFCMSRPRVGIIRTIHVDMVGGVT